MTVSLTAWVDSHCHLQWVDDPDRAVARAVAAGVERMVCVGTDLESSLRAIEIAEAHAQVWATVGLHPHEASRFDHEWDQIAALASADRVVGIGEAGFDFHYMHSPRDAQEKAFRAQIGLAKEAGRALVIHTREAWPETFAVLGEEGTPERTVFHCFTGGPEEGGRAVDAGACLSFSGIVTFDGAADVRAAAATAPAGALLVETDSPYLTPVPHRGRPNEPAHVRHVGAAVAAARGETAEAVAAATVANADRVFRFA